MDKYINCLRLYISAEQSVLFSFFLSKNIFFKKKKRCPTLEITPVSWVRSQTCNVTYTRHPDPEHISAGHTNICSVRESNPRPLAQQSNAQPLRQPSCQLNFISMLLKYFF